MTHRDNTRSSLTCRWVLLVSLILLLTPSLLAVPAPGALIEIFDTTEVTVPENMEAVPASLESESVATSLPVSVASPSMSSMSATGETATLAFSESVASSSSSSSSLSPNFSPEEMVRPEPPPYNLVTAVTSDSLANMQPESADVVTPETVVLLAETVILQADNSDFKETLPILNNLQDEVHTTLLAIPVGALEANGNTEAATSETVASVVETFAPLEISTSAKPTKSETDTGSTVASSNAPATTTTNENEELATTVEAVATEQQKPHEQESKANGKKKDAQMEDESKQSDTYTYENEQQTFSHTQQQQQIAAAITEQQELQHQQTFATDMPMQAEGDIHKQSTGNAEIVVTTSYIVADNSRPVVQAIAETPATVQDDAAALQNAENQQEEELKKHETEAVYESTTFEHFANEDPPMSGDARKTETQIVLDSLQPQLAATHTTQALFKSVPGHQMDKQMTLEDFKPLIQDANRQLLQERTIFTPKRDQREELDWKQNLLPNEVDDYDHPSEPAKLYSNPYEHNINWSPYLHPAAPVVDFTGKVLQEKDGVITEIEQKFRLNEFATDAAEKTTDVPTEVGKPEVTNATNSTTTTQNPTTPASPDVSTKSLARPLKSVNHEILQNSKQNHNQQHHQTTPWLTSHIAVVRPRHEFIERRVKKSFDFPMHRMASDASSPHTMQHFDFANTKFSSNFNEPMQHLATNTNGANAGTGAGAGVGAGAGAGAGAAVNQGHDTDAVVHVPRPQPEFSTTKFYNSKELYNEMLQHKSKQQQQQHLQQLHDKDNGNALNMQQHKDEVATPSLTLNSFAVLHSPKIAKLEELHELHEPQKSLAIKRVTVQATKHKENANTDSKEPMTTSGISSKSATTTTTAAAATATTTRASITTPSSTSTSTTSASAATTTSNPSTALPPVKKFHKELKKAKLLLKTMLPARQIIRDKANVMSSSLLPPAVTPDPSGGQQAQSQDQAHSPSASSELTPPPPPIPSPSATASSSSSSQPSFVYSSNLQTLTTVKPLDTLKTESLPNTLTASNTRTSYASSGSASAAASATDYTSWSSSSSQYAAKTAGDFRSGKEWLTASGPTVATSGPMRADTSTNPTKSPLKPIVRPRILSRLQEKINSLECEMQNMPQDSHLWRGNETHELLLPIMTPENCKTDKDCTAMMVSWEGEAEIQSGDILIVEVNDALLNPKDVNVTTSAHNTQVYQVTRSGHEHCDVTEGILLDITPLIVDGRKLVTLYDKDLTEGVNLLIVVSELWGSQCVRLKVTTKTENCGENADCSGKGVCFSNTDMEEYECQCCSGFAGPHCEEIDACTPSPCTNNGICVDLSQGHEGNSYQCLCPYGYTGKNCQYELDPCNSAECMNGGSCVGNSTHFRCECSPGYTGPLCQHSLNECESSPCIHGICVDQEDGFRCFCQPGFAGELCNFEYNECESNPCQNGGECIDHIGSYECHCSKGYTGNRCHIKVDFCANKPCPDGRRCIDHGNDYSCECLGGRNGPDCNEMQRTQCTVNPCTHGGTCWSSGDSFYCACRPGYTGKMCEDEFVVETVVSSSEFMVDDTSARNFNDKSFGSSVVLKSPIELHNAYTAAIVLALVIFFVALYLTICHCKVNQTYRKFSTRTYGFLPIIGIRWRSKQATSKISRHWLSGKGLNVGNAMRPTSSSGSGGGGGATNSLTSLQRNNSGHLPTANSSASHHQHAGQLNERPFQRHLAMNLENDMYYTVDFSENSQHSPLIQ